MSGLVKIAFVLQPHEVAKAGCCNHLFISFNDLFQQFTHSSAK